jgi:twitching motility protein PilJ
VARPACDREGASGETTSPALADLMQQIEQQPGELPPPQFELWQPLLSTLTNLQAMQPQWLELQQRGMALLPLEGEFFTLTQGVTTLMQRRGAAGDQLLIAARQEAIAERILSATRRLLMGDGTLQTETLRQDLAQFKRVLNGLLAGDAHLGVRAVRVPKGDELMERLQDLAGLFSNLESHILLLLEGQPLLNEWPLALDRLMLVVDRIVLASSSTPRPARFDAVMPLLALAAAAALAILLLLFQLLQRQRQGLYDLLQGERDASRVAAAQRQQALIRLQEEMAELARGNLAVNASVGDATTGAIADALNFCVDALRSTLLAIQGGYQQQIDTHATLHHTLRDLRLVSDQHGEQIATIAADLEEQLLALDDYQRHSQQLVAEANHAVAEIGAAEGHFADLQRAMAETSAALGQLAGQQQRLSDAAADLDGLLAPLEEMANEAHLLAMNGAIQSALAVEGGRGLSVINDGVAQLAARLRQTSQQAIQRMVALEQSGAAATAAVTAAVSAFHLATLRCSDSEQMIAGYSQVSRYFSLLLRDHEAVAREQNQALAAISQRLDLFEPQVLNFFNVLQGRTVTAIACSSRCVICSDSLAICI